MTEQYSPQDTYEIIENDNEEVMILIFANGNAPQKPTFSLDKKNKALELSKSPDEQIVLDGLQPETLVKLNKLETLYVCEIKYNEKETADNEIVYAYAATLKKKVASHEQKAQNQPQQQETLTQKARKARENILKSNNE